ncbi:MAG TPA: hypothetical protein VF070_20195 [Streptosporangiaceae bacterium]
MAAEVAGHWDDFPALYRRMAPRIVASLAMSQLHVDHGLIASRLLESWLARLGSGRAGGAGEGLACLVTVGPARVPRLQPGHFSAGNDLRAGDDLRHHRHPRTVAWHLG